MTPDQQTVLYIVLGLFALSFLWKRREAIAHMVRGVVGALLIMVVVFFFLRAVGVEPLLAYVAALVIGVSVRRAQPARSRHVRARVKRQVIAKWERETGKTFNRRVHELDHAHPFSRGGGNSEENLQVLKRKENRSKGAKLGWRDKA